MKLIPFSVGLGFVLGGLFWGCQATPPAPTRSEQSETGSVPRTRNNAYSLLHELLAEEQHLSKLLIIKRDRRELNRLVKSISATAGQGAESLEEFAKIDPSLNLKESALPPGEQATRQAIAHTKKKKLLGTSGMEFERNLLLTQVEALNYGAHLAQVASKHDDNETRVRFLLSLSRELQGLSEQVEQLLFAAASPPHR
jgi:hypothetical protein